MMNEDPLPDISVTLEQIETDDRIVLNGALADARSRRIGVLFIHGLMSNIFKTQHLWKHMASEGRRHGIGVLALQTRGHDIAANYRIQTPKNSTKKPRYKQGGSGFESFTESIRDIKAGVRHLKRAGYKKIVLIGHSTGANKAIYYMAKTKDPNVSGVVLAGPARDIFSSVASLGSLKQHLRLLGRVQHYVTTKNKNELLPKRFSDGNLISGQRYISLNKPGSSEDVFPYGEPKASWTKLGSLEKPLMIIFGEEDPYLDGFGPEQLVALMNTKAKRAKSVTADILPNQGHSFREDPKAFAKSVIGWLRKQFV